jgi:hypothetical protein
MVTGEGEVEHESVTRGHERYGFRFFPLATRELSLVCSVKVLFLRPDLPGRIISSGDIDNRMKTIFDALRLPHNEAELGGHTPQEGETPFVVLLQDDSLISHAEIETDILLAPVSEVPRRNDARLVLTIGLHPVRVTLKNLGFG